MDMEKKKYTGRRRLSRKALLLETSLTAVFVALAVAIELLTKSLPHVEFPQGGTLSLTCLPLMFGSLICGPVWGTVGGALYGIFNFLLDGYSFSWGSFLFDYLVAFAMMGLAGLFRRPFLREKLWAFFVGSILAMVGRYLSHCVSGTVFFADYAPEGVSPILYSFILYNAPYCFGSLGLDLVVGALIFYPFQRLLGTSSFSPILALVGADVTDDPGVLLLRCLLTGEEAGKDRALAGLLEQGRITVGTASLLLGSSLSLQDKEIAQAVFRAAGRSIRWLSPSERRRLLQNIR